jgi:nucleoside phosphorylase
MEQTTFQVTVSGVRFVSAERTTTLHLKDLPRPRTLQITIARSSLDDAEQAVHDWLVAEDIVYEQVVARDESAINS